MAQYELNLRDYWLVLRKRKWIIVCTVLLVASFTFITTELSRAKPLYEAFARVKFDRATSQSGLMMEVFSLSQEGSNIATQAEVIRSVPVLLRAAKKLGVIAKEVESNEVRTSPASLAQLYELKGQVSVSREESTNILKIEVTSDEPEFAARLANAVAEGYREENIASRNRQVNDAKLFVQDQLKLVDEALRKSEQALLAFKEHEGRVFLNEEARQALENYSRLQAELAKLGQVKREASGQLRTMSERENSIKESIARFKERYITLPKAALQLASLEREVKVNGDLYANLKQKHQEFLIRGAERIEEVSIIEPAVTPGSPKNAPQATLNLMLSSLIGVLLGFVLAFVRESMDTSIGTIEGVEEFLKVPVLGVIPQVDRTEMERTIQKVFPQTLDAETVELLSRLSPLFDLKGVVAEGDRSLKVNLQFACADRTVKSLVFASAGLGEGKTTTVINLAITIAQDGRRVLVVDADLRKPAVHSRLGLKREPGLSEVLVGNAQWQDVVQTAPDLMLGKLGFDQILSAPGVDNLSIITSGHLPPNPSEFFNTQRVVDLIAACEENYDLVVFDCPPILPVADAVLIGPKVDGVVLVYQVGKIGRTPLLRAKTLLENAQAHIVGVVLSNVSAEFSPDYHQYQYYRYSS